MPQSLATFVRGSAEGLGLNAGKEGRALTFVDSEDRRLVKDIVKVAQAKLQERVIPEATVKKWTSKIESMAGDIEKLVWVRLPPDHGRRAYPAVLCLEYMK